MPDWSHYEPQAYDAVEHRKGFNMGALQFEKRVSRRLRPTNQKDTSPKYNSGLILHGLEAQACTKDVKCLVQMDRQSKRDGMMYPFEKQDLAAIAR